jgi:hypothetical protein
MIATPGQTSLSVADLLNAAVEASQPTREQHERATRSYGHVGGWICDPNGSLAWSSPQYSPQGSFVYGTVVRPLWQHEFDLDALARLNINPYRVSSDEAYRLVSERIAEHGDLRKRMELHARCVRLKYKDDFHHDVTPACDDPRPGGAMLIRAKPEERADGSPWSSWKANDAFGFARWFATRNTTLLESRVLASVDPEPPYIPASQKTPLRKIVQLVKMRRNRFYKPDNVPSSILLTTMAAQCYSGQAFSLEANIEIVGSMSAWAQREGDLLRVPHPTLADEDLAKGLNAEGKSRLREFLRQYQSELIDLGNQRGIHRICEGMGTMYESSAVDSAVRGIAASVQDARARDALHVGRVGVPLVVVTGRAMAGDIMPRPNPPHSFYGGPLDQ